MVHMASQTPHRPNSVTGRMSEQNAAAQILTPLAERLRARIGTKSIAVRDYFDACLHDPDHGYYRSQPAIGAAGDFITAPEISQVFGELLGLWCAVTWQAMGKPERVNLVELGPGRGTLIKDVLRATRIMPAFRTAAHIHLIESNPVLCDVQWETLSAETVPMTWHRDLATALGPGGSIDPHPTIILANEFLDTLAVDQYVVNGPYWCGRRVAVERDQFVFRPTTAPRMPAIPPELVGRERPGDVFEICPGHGTFARDILLPRAEAAPLAALFLDYGHVKSGFGSSLQAVKSHKSVSVFHAPGESDLTAQVDFQSFAARCREAHIFHADAAATAPSAATPSVPRRRLMVDGPITQSEFLGSMGIAERASRLMAASPEAAGRLEAGVARLMAPIGMGGRFKVCAVRSSDLAPLIAPATQQPPRTS